MSSEKYIELETKISFQEHSLQELNNVVINQQKQIDQLQIVIERLKGQLQSVADRMPDDHSDNQPPPHY